MAHCPPELLDDIADLIARTRDWPGVVQRSPGVLYARRQPFLHFHLMEGRRRRADVKGAAGWTSFDLPQPISASKRRAFLRLLQTRYRETQPRSCGRGKMP